ncbi:hypothetical protein HDU87_005344 [Geranomyces variabilis]|uniref:Uncharacterized protein n=1 Tax=Geranomyces variabilis TaxID=109894 RepID=A0AAD5TMG9_9FUNG|nr:hypothetical protein HDU87_005344 [Geranomyces variabilis]
MLSQRSPLVPQKTNLPGGINLSASISSPKTIDEENLPPRGTASQLAKNYLFQTKKGRGGGPRGAAGLGNPSYFLSKAFSDSLRPAATPQVSANAAENTVQLEPSTANADQAVASQRLEDRSPSPISSRDSPRQSPTHDRRDGGASSASQSSSDSSDFAVHLADLTFNGSPGPDEEEDHSLHYSALNDDDSTTRDDHDPEEEFNRQGMRQNGVGLAKTGNVLDMNNTSFESRLSNSLSLDPPGANHIRVERSPERILDSYPPEVRPLKEIPLESRSGYVPLQAEDTPETLNLVKLDTMNDGRASLRILDDRTPSASDPSPTNASTSKVLLDNQSSEELSQARRELAWLRNELASAEQASEQHHADAQKFKKQLLAAEEACGAEQRNAIAFDQKWRAAEGQIKLVERGSIDEITRLSSELERLREDSLAKDREIQGLRQQKSVVSEEDANAMAEMIDLLGHEKEELMQSLHFEKAKTFRNEADFRMFERKIRSLQEQNSRLQTETERLRVDLRRLQYEGQIASSQSEADGFYKQRLEEALLDNEALRALLESSTPREPQPRIPAAAPTPRPMETAQVYPFLDASASTRRPPSAPQAPGPTLHRAKSFAAWGSETRAAPPPQQPYYHPGDRDVFDRKLKGYENPTTTRPTTPATSATMAAMTPATKRVVRGSSSALSPDNPFSTVRDLRTAAWPDSAAPTPSRRRARPLSESQMPSASSSPLPGSAAARNFSQSNASAISFGPPPHQQTAEYADMRDQLNEELAALTARKASLASEMSRIPISGGTGRVRQRKEEIDVELDQVTQMMSTVRRRMRENGVL